MLLDFVCFVNPCCSIYLVRAEKWADFSGGYNTFVVNRFPVYPLYPLIPTGPSR